MPEIQLSDNAEEVLARLWVASEEEDDPSCPVSELEVEDRDHAVAQLLELDFVERSGDELSLTETGRKEARSIVRRERLAERLLTDVFDLGTVQATEAACQFEHVLRRGIDDQICTLLGHPKVCPHGSPIPPGECCRAGARAAEKVVSALAELQPGQAGVVAYVHGQRREMMQRMLAMGVLPGSPIALIQKAPSIVFQIGQTQLAVDRETAQNIYVRVTGRRPAPRPSIPWLPGFRARRHRHRPR